MMKLYRIKLEFEAFRISDNEENALEMFWDDVVNGEGVDTFIDHATQTTEISEANDLQEENENGIKK